MSRINKLENIYKDKLKDKDIKDISVFIQSVVNADITKGKYARFLIEAFLNDKFLEEDLIGGLESTIGQAISLFDKHKGKLPLEHRSVYALNPETKLPLYQSPGDLWNNVKQFQGELSGKELKKEEQEQIYRETEFIYKDEETGFQIVTPLTEESAKWWGKGTRWCTSAENNNLFDYYTKQAPLLILLIPNNGDTAGNGDKLQLWKNGNDIQFMNEADNTVSLGYIKQNWNILEPICLWLNDLKFIPERLKTKELCESIIKNNGLSLEYVPNKLKTKGMCELAVKQNGESLQFVSEELKTNELYELAVQNNGLSLSFIPERLRTRKICELAVKQDGLALRYVPDKCKTSEICKFAITQNGNAISSILTKYKTPELCKLAIIQNGLSLKFIPRELKTKDLCELAIKQNKLALQYVPKEYRPSELCTTMKQDIEILKSIPEIKKQNYDDCYWEIKKLFSNHYLSLDI